MAKIDKEKCMGCGFCVAVCPEVFEMGEQGKAKIKEGADLKANEKCIREAKEGCPVEAIED